jgi:hypothetical protein
LAEEQRVRKARSQELGYEPAFDPRELLTDENRALLAFFAAEVARFLELGLSRRLDEIELKLQELDPVNARDAGTLREILRMFSRYKLSRVLHALCEYAMDGSPFTKNSLIRSAGVGQGFRSEGLDRLIEILAENGLIVEDGTRGRGILYRFTGAGRRFFESYVPNRQAIDG